MQELSEYCQKYSGPLLASDQVIEGKMYAAQYEDGGWYRYEFIIYKIYKIKLEITTIKIMFLIFRAIVPKSLDKNTFAVYFCDYGDYRPVNIEKLLPLTETLKDSLPKQAIKAKLHGNL